MALPVLCLGTGSPANAMASAIMMAAPRPCTARAAISSETRRRDAAQDRGQREQEDSGEQQPAAADDVTEPSGADDQGGDGEQIGEDDPLDFLERGAECLRQGRQSTLAMLMPSEDSSIDSERLASAQRAEGVTSGDRPICNEST